MSDETNAPATPAAEADGAPMFQIQRMYLKDLSLEQPNAPAIFTEQSKSQVDINLTLGYDAVEEGVYEVTVTATVNTHVGDRTMFLIEAKQAGVFEIRNVPPQQLDGLLGIVCPQMIYPYVRAIVSDVCSRACFPPVILSEVNFQALYEAQKAQQAQQAAAAPQTLN